MKRIEVEIFTEPTNNAVIRLLDRRYPGVLIQGDSLCALFVDAVELARTAGRCGDAELVENARTLQDNLDDLLNPKSAGRR